jgi:hypothetical protein
MTKSEINEILGEPKYHRNDVMFPGLLHDTYGQKNVTIEYLAQDLRAVFIEVSYPFKVLYYNEDLIRMPLSSAKALFEKNGLMIEKREVRPGFWHDICILKGFGLNSISETSKHLYSVYMFKSGYYDMKQKLWQEMKKGLPQKIENMFREFGIPLPPHLRFWGAS